MRERKEREGKEADGIMTKMMLMTRIMMHEISFFCLDYLTNYHFSGHTTMDRVWRGHLERQIVHEGDRIMVPVPWLTTLTPWLLVPMFKTRYVV
jgi:hypothetical protein